MQSVVLYGKRNEVVECSSHNIMVHRGRVTAEIFMNSTVAYGSSCDCV